LQQHSNGNENIPTQTATLIATQRASAAARVIQI
jgi:hypothetical protein